MTPSRTARRSAAIAAAFALAACAPTPGTETVRSTSRAAVAFDRRGGDVWAFERRLVGRASGECATVAVAGSVDRVVVRPHRGRFAATVRLRSGPNRVRAECLDRASRVLARSEVQLVGRLEDRPTARVRVSVFDGAVVLDAGASEPSPVDRAPIVATTWSVRASNPEPLALEEGGAIAGATLEQITARVPGRDGEYFVTLEVRDARGAVDRAEAYFRVEGGKAVAVDPRREPPSWAARAIVYGTVPHLFGERPFAAVTERLPALAELGMNTLWLTPVQAAPPGDFGYEVLDHFRIREDLGTPEELAVLVDRAHALGMRVLFDFVPNHTSRAHAYFEDAEAFGRRSSYFDFYERDTAGEPVHYFDWEHLPNLDFDRAEVRRMIVEAAAHFVRRYGVDGFRVDVAWGVDRRAPELFGEVRDEITRIRADALLLAEASARDPGIGAAGFDAAYDWTDEVGKWAWAGVFVDGRADLRALDEALAARPPAPLVFGFLDNNDTGPRFAAVHGSGLHRAASALLFTLPGIPSLFTGEEYEVRYEPYQQESPIVFEGPAAVRAHFARLARLRTESDALRGDGLVRLAAEPADRVIAFLRTATADGSRPRRGRGEETLLVVIQFGDAPVVARVRVDGEAARALGTTLVDRLEGGARPVFDDGLWAIPLAPFGARVLARPPGTALAARSTSWSVATTGARGASPRARTSRPSSATTSRPSSR